MTSSPPLPSHSEAAKARLASSDSAAMVTTMPGRTTPLVAGSRGNVTSVVGMRAPRGQHPERDDYVLTTQGSIVHSRANDVGIPRQGPPGRLVHRAAGGALR